MRLTKLVTVALATAALAVSSAMADPGHGKGKGKPSCKPAPVKLAGTLANDPATGETSLQLTVKHANRLGRLYAKGGQSGHGHGRRQHRYRKDGGSSTLDALAQNDRALVFAKVCRADVKKAKQSGGALPDPDGPPGARQGAEAPASNEATATSRPAGVPASGAASGGPACFLSDIRGRRNRRPRALTGENRL